MSPATTRTVQAPPTFPKPTYPDAFNWVAALPPEINPYTIILLLWVWRHTNSDTTNENCGKAWKSQANLAVEMHVSDKTVQRAFDDAELRGFITREHIFKTKDGKITVSTIPYRKGTNQGRGEYQHSRYWLNWDTIRELGVVTESTPTKLGCSQSPPQTENGVVTESTPKQIGVVTESTGVVTESTKVLIEGFSSPARPLPWVDLTHRARDERQGGESNQGWGTVVDDGKIFVLPGGFGVSPSVKAVSAVNPSASPSSTSGESPLPPGAQEGTPDPSENRIVTAFEDVFDRIKSEAGKLWSERRLKREIELESDAVFRTTVAQCKEAAKFYRALGSEETLRMWEEFLVTVNHAVTTSDDSPQRSWYLKDFIKWGDRQLVRLRELQAEAEEGCPTRVQ
jgi:hypothetical protein